MDLHRGRFLQNGKSGYVLKPAVLREGEEVMKSTLSAFVTYLISAIDIISIDFKAVICSTTMFIFTTDVRFRGLELGYLPNMQ